MAPADAAARQRHPGFLAARRSPALHGRAWGRASVFARGVRVSVSACVIVCVCQCECASVSVCGGRAGRTAGTAPQRRGSGGAGGRGGGGA